MSKAIPMAPLTVSKAVALYLDHLGFEVRASTVATTRYRLVGLLHMVGELPIAKIAPHRAQALYSAYRIGRAASTHHGALRVAVVFFDWAVDSKVIRSNPFQSVRTVGRRSRGKPQLRLDEAVKLYQYLVPRAATEDGALGVLMALLLGFRASEIVSLVGRDLDDGGRVLHVAKAKTRAGVRPLRLPDELQGPLAARSRVRTGRLLPFTRWWLLDMTKRYCAAAGVPPVGAHSLRGLNATLALEAGMAPLEVARSLGQMGTSTLRGHYAAGNAGESARVEAVAVLMRGRDAAL